MAGPWEKYAQQPAQDGPWSKYRAASSEPDAPQTSLVDDIKQGVGNIVAGGIRGAGSIGATLLYPIDKATDLIKGDRGPNVTGLVTGKQPLSRNEERRQQMDEGLRSLGADPDSLMYKGGKLAGEIAGTAGAGSLLAGGVRATPVVVNALRPGAVPAFTNMLARAEPVLQSISTSGMSSGGIAGARGLAARIGGGAVAGGASAGLVNPDDAGMGAVIGGGIPAAGALLKGAGRSVAAIAGMQTGAGSTPVREAFKAGRAGGEAQRSFTENMRGNADIGDVLAAARQNLDDITRRNQDIYRSGMVDIKSDRSMLDFSGIDKTLSDAFGKITFKGQVKNERAANALGRISEAVNEWKGLDPAEFHTPEGLDALKQRVGALLEDIPFEQKQARMVVGNVYHAIKDTITKQAPTYAKVMKDATDGHELVSGIQSTLSLGKKASDDTALRKLQSVMRNNANANYGARAEMMQELESGGRNMLVPALAGQSLSSLTPRSLQGATAGGLGLGAFMAGGAPAAAGALALSSPRIVGEAALKAGQASRYMDKASINKLAEYLMRAAPAAAAD